MNVVTEDIVREINPDVDGIVLTVPVEQLHVDNGYARPLARQRVNAIKRDYSSRSVGFLLVNMRANGDMYIMDGVHRYIAISELGMRSVRCLVFDGLTIPQEAEVFVRCNTARKQPVALEVFAPRLLAGDMQALGLKSAIDDAGVIIGKVHGVNDPPNMLSAIAAVEKIYARTWTVYSGREYVTWILKKLRSIWPSDQKALHSDMIEGFDIFHRTYDGKYDADVLDAKLQEYSVAAIRRAASEFKITGDSGRAKSIALALLNVYNWKRKTTRLDNILN